MNFKKPLSFNLILGKSAPRSSLICSHLPSKTGLQNWETQEKQTVNLLHSCLFSVLYSLWTTLNSGANTINYISNSRPLRKQAFLGASSDPFCIPQILCSNAFPTQLYISALVLPSRCRSMHSKALTEPVHWKGLPKSWDVILYELGTWQRGGQHN